MKGLVRFKIMKRASTLFMMLHLIMLSVTIVRGEDSGEPPAPQKEEHSLTEINKKLTNPVSTTWSIKFQQNNYVLTIPGRGSGYWDSNLQFQPVMPISLTPNWNLITRPVIPFFTSVPFLEKAPYSSSTEVRRSTALGDTILMTQLSPSSKLTGNWLLGAGPTFIFPTATDVHNGQGKWQVGPSAIVGYFAHKWVMAAFLQDWISYAGEKDRDSVHQMNLQPIASYFLSRGWGIIYSGNILANWKARDSSEVWTVPLGIGVSKVLKFGKLPVQFSVAGQYMPIHPHNFGQKWNIQLQVSPVIPKLIKGYVLGD